MISYIDEEPFLSAEKLLGKSKTKVPETCIVTWQNAFLKYVEKSNAKKVFSFNTGIVQDVYKFEYSGKEIGFTVIAMGGPNCAHLMEELNVLGCRNFVFIGSCGVLSDTVGTKMIVPTMAFRDEGTSWHYIESKDEFINISTAKEVSAILTELEVPFIEGPTWTTDALFRETPSAIKLMKQKGCLCVEMECASIMAVAQRKKLKARQVLFTADRLDSKEWKAGELGYKNKKAMEKYFEVALAIALN